MKYVRYFLVTAKKYPAGADRTVIHYWAFFNLFSKIIMLYRQQIIITQHLEIHFIVPLVAVRFLIPPPEEPQI